MIQINFNVQVILVVFAIMTKIALFQVLNPVLILKTVRKEMQTVASSELKMEKKG